MRRRSVRARQREPSTGDGGRGTSKIRPIIPSLFPESDPEDKEVGLVRPLSPTWLIL